MRFRSSPLWGAALLAVGLLWGNDKKEKKNDAKATLGKVFFADPKTRNWMQLTCSPEDSIYLNCMDAAGKFRPRVVEGMEPAGLQSQEFPSNFLLRLIPHQKNDEKTITMTLRW